jgi:hypothetical protein
LPLVALLAVTVSVPARSHHSAAVYYLLDRQVAITGTVTRYTLGNPHSRIELRVKGADGSYEEWVAEGGSRTALMRKGWTGEELELGDVVAIVGNPARDGSNTIHWQTVSLPNGRRVGEREDSEEPERESSSPVK